VWNRLEDGVNTSRELVEVRRKNLKESKTTLRCQELPLQRGRRTYVHRWTKNNTWIREASSAGGRGETSLEPI